jgi:alpha,alpha-trehalose phosphorylase
VTGDIDYLAEEGAEILWETARLWLDAGHYDQDGRFRVDCVTGPDEYTCIVNNNYYTNKGAKENLLGAARVYRLLSQKGLLEKMTFRVTENEIDQFSRAAEHMYLPYDEKYGIYSQDDTFLQKKVWDIKSIPPENFPLLLHYHPLYINRHQICKQADTVLALWLFDANEDEKVIERSFDYYEPLTTHDSSLSACVFSIVASRLRRLERAYEYFKRTVGTDIKDAQGNTSHGLHIANAGGAWLAVTAGFAGLRIREDGLHFRPECPESWKSYTFRLRYLESELQVRVSGTAAEFTLLSGSPIAVFVGEKAYSLKGELIFDVPGGNIRS